MSKNGSAPTQAKVEVIQNFPQPSTIKGLQEFLGMINFYHRFLPNIASILSPLYGALKSSKPQQEISWSHQMKQAFVAAKCALVNATVLAHPCSDCPLALTSDASDRAVGAVLEQFKQGQWQPPAFFFRQLRNAELKYSVSTVSLSVYIWQFNISGSCWKEDSSRFTRTTNHSFTQWLKQQSYSHQDNRDISPLSQNSPLTYDMFLVKIT